MTSFFDRIGWTPTIGDPTLVGWFTVFAYFFCAYQSFRVLRFGERIFAEPPRRERALWLIVACTLAFLGVNKQLDLQTLFTASARYLALQSDWYGSRRQLQAAFIGLVALAGMGAIVCLFVLFRKLLRRHALAIVGLCTLVVFVLVRATSFHYMDILIGKKIFGLYVNWILELGGILLISLNARSLYRQRRPLIDISDMRIHEPHTRRPHKS